MQPGRELDALVAERVLGWTDVKMLKYGPHGKPPGWTKTGIFRVPPFSTDIAQAFSVVKRINELGYALKITAVPIDYTTIVEVIKLEKELATSLGSVAGEIPIPHAICLAALKAVQA